MTEFKPGDLVRSTAEVMEVSGDLIAISQEGEYIGWIPGGIFELLPHPWDASLEVEVAALMESWGHFYSERAEWPRAAARDLIALVLKKTNDKNGTD